MVLVGFSVGWIVGKFLGDTEGSRVGGTGVVVECRFVGVLVGWEFGKLVRNVE